MFKWQNILRKTQNLAKSPTALAMKRIQCSEARVCRSFTRIEAVTTISNYIHRPRVSRLHFSHSLFKAITRNKIINTTYINFITSFIILFSFHVQCWQLVLQSQRIIASYYITLLNFAIYNFLLTAVTGKKFVK